MGRSIVDIEIDAWSSSDGLCNRNSPRPRDETFPVFRKTVRPLHGKVQIRSRFAFRPVTAGVTSVSLDKQTKVYQGPKSGTTGTSAVLTNLTCSSQQPAALDRREGADLVARPPSGNAQHLRRRACRRPSCGNQGLIFGQSCDSWGSLSQVASQLF